MDWSGKEIAEGAAAVLVVLALLAGIADWRHRRRHDLDTVSLFDWRNVQVYLLIAAVITGAFVLAL